MWGARTWNESGENQNEIKRNFHVEKDAFWSDKAFIYFTSYRIALAYEQAASLQHTAIEARRDNPYSSRLQVELI